jgi:nicotinate-nucleotide adenylyltransferase
MRLIGLLGGTFDPIHYGHIGLAREAQEQLELDQVRLIPVNVPPHRSAPVASATHRQTMIELAIDNEPHIFIDCRELESKDISYTINTLKSLRQEFIDDALCLIVGRDAFNKLDSWKDWQGLLDYAHIIVANRPGESHDTVSSQLNNFIAQHQTEDLSLLKERQNGYIYFIDIPMLDISSTLIRQRYTEDKPVDEFLPLPTLTYIKDNKLYLDTA